MPLERKNAIQIYDQGFRPALLKYGIWDTLRFDKGTEAVLMRFAQLLLADQRRPGVEVEPVCNSTSVHNTTVEHTWKTCNQEVTLPLYHTVQQMEGGRRGRGEFNVETDDVAKFCVKYVLGPFLSYRIKVFASGMANCRIQSRGGMMPSHVAQYENQCHPINPLNVPSTEFLVHLFESNGGSDLLRDTEGVVKDPLLGFPHYQLERDRLLNLTEAEVARIHEIQNRTYLMQPLQDKIRLCINFTRQCLWTINQ